MSVHSDNLFSVLVESDTYPPGTRHSRDNFVEGKRNMKESCTISNANDKNMNSNDRNKRKNISPTKKRNSPPRKNNSPPGINKSPINSYSNIRKTSPNNEIDVSGVNLRRRRESQEENIDINKVSTTSSNNDFMKRNSSMTDLNKNCLIDRNSSSLSSSDIDLKLIGEFPRPVSTPLDESYSELQAMFHNPNIQQPIPINQRKISLSDINDTNTMNITQNKTNNERKLQPPQYYTPDDSDNINECSQGQVYIRDKMPTDFYNPYYGANMEYLRQIYPYQQIIYAYGGYHPSMNYVPFPLNNSYYKGGIPFPAELSGAPPSMDVDLNVNYKSNLSQNMNSRTVLLPSYNNDGFSQKAYISSDSLYSHNKESNNDLEWQSKLIPSCNSHNVRNEDWNSNMIDDNITPLIEGTYLDLSSCNKEELSQNLRTKTASLSHKQNNEDSPNEDVKKYTTLDSLPTPIFDTIFTTNDSRQLEQRIDEFNTIDSTSNDVEFVKYNDYKKAIIQNRGGIIPFTVKNGKVIICAGVDFGSNEVTDFGGKAKHNENAIQAAIREFHEETFGVFKELQLDEEQLIKKIGNSFILCSRKTLILFVRIDCDFEQKRKEFLEIKNTKKYPEVSDFYISGLDNIFREIIKGEKSNVKVYKVVNNLLQSAFRDYGILSFYLLDSD